MDRSVSSSLSDAREALINAAMDALASFGNTIPPAQRIGSLPICYTLRMIPTFILALLKSVRFHLLTRLLENFSFHLVEHFTYIYLNFYIKFCLIQKAFRVGVNTPLDDRVFGMQQCKSLPVGQLLKSVYADLYPVHGIEKYVSFMYKLEAISQS